jgi:hypothetical protein
MYLQHRRSANRGCCDNTTVERTIWRAVHPRDDPRHGAAEAGHPALAETFRASVSQSHEAVSILEVGGDEAPVGVKVDPAVGVRREVHPFGRPAKGLTLEATKVVIGTPRAPHGRPPHPRAGQSGSGRSPSAVTQNPLQLKHRHPDGADGQGSGVR